MIDWSTIESAVIAWVEGAGVTAILSGQGGPRPPRPFVSVRLELGGVEGLDSVEVSDADSPEPGAEIVKTHRGNRVLTISMQAFSADAAGSESAGAILSAVALRASLDTVRDALNAAGIGISAIGKVSRIDGVLNSTIFEPRAIMEARALVPSEISEAATYIETVEVTNQIPDPDETFDVP